MLRFRMEIVTGNAAFTDDASMELQAALGDVKARLNEGETAGAILDANGNSVGSWSLTDNSDDAVEREFHRGVRGA